MLQWFVGEQVEEEENTSEAVQQIEIAGGNGHCYPDAGPREGDKGLRGPRVGALLPQAGTGDGSLTLFLISERLYT